MPVNGRFAPEATLGGLEIHLPPYPRNRTQLGNRGMSEMCPATEVPMRSPSIPRSLLVLL
jgi:hypothetical protein